VTTRNRSRPRGTLSYTARLQQRTAAPRPRRHRPDWLTTRHLPALLTVSAELGHLAAAVTEWPAAPQRGLFHVLAAACLGLVATFVYFGHSRSELIIGVALTVALPSAWPAGALLHLSPFHDFPALAAAALSAVELGAAALFAVHTREAGR
jgi:hypothetical protein